MAPVTRNRQAGGVSKKAAPARKPRASRMSPKDSSDTWAMLGREQEDDHEHHYNGDLVVASREDPQHDDEDEEAPHHYNGHLAVSTREEPDVDVDEAIHPLREMAERVGREVETFAENLDNFFDQLPTARSPFEAVLELVGEFQAIAKDAVYSLKKQYQREYAQELRREWGDTAKVSTQVGSAPRKSGERNRAEVQKLRRWQQEVDIWELFRLVLELHHNPDRRGVQQEKEEALRKLGNVHRYTSESEIWERFLLQDDLAKERATIKTWLEDTAEHQESDLPGIMEELEAKAGRGKGLWSHGWMHTREKIKGEKRLRSWPTSPGAPLPHIQRTDNNELLVTSLDPDAASRQERTLEKPDAYFERAMWIACWEMLRRGNSWEAVSEWCRHRNESWRALSIGKATPLTEVLSHTVWRNMCYLASQSPGLSDYEAAVYGLLGGSVNAVQKVCRTVDDSLYAYYSAALLRQFDQYLASNYPERASHGRRAPPEDVLKEPQQQIVDLILKLRKQQSTSSESVSPMKIIESYLLADDVGSMLHTMGYALAYADRARGRTEEMIIHLVPFWPEDANQPEIEVALDPQPLRIAMHMAILLRILSIEELDGDERDAEDNVTVAYIQALRAVGKRDLIPLYASRLKLGRYVVTMGRVLEDVTTPGEQESMLALMNNYGMDNIMVLNEQVAYLLNEYVAPGLRQPQPLKMLERSEDTHLYPGQRIIAGFLPSILTGEDEAIVRSLQWYSIVKGHWKDTFSNMSFALRKCLVAGKVACALSIVHELPYENVSIRKSYQVLGKSINVMEYDGPFPADEQARWELLREQSRTYYELERLMLAIRALSEWREVESEVTKSKQNMHNSSAPPDLRSAKDEVDFAMDPILTGNILQHPIDADEARDLDFIRSQYLPEIIIAYNTVLHSAGSLISRENLISSMDLSVTVASEKAGLTECFVSSGRMRELVTSFALTSKAMLILKARGKPWKRGRDREGKDLGMWEVGPQGAVGSERDVSL